MAEKPEGKQPDDPKKGETPPPEAEQKQPPQPTVPTGAGTPMCSRRPDDRRSWLD